MAIAPTKHQRHHAEHRDERRERHGTPRRPLERLCQRRKAGPQRSRLTFVQQAFGTHSFDSLLVHRRPSMWSLGRVSPIRSMP